MKATHIMNTQTNAANLANSSDIDSLLDGTLDDLADMPEFKPFPAGAHRITIKWALKAINGNTCPEMSMKAIETVELANTDDTPCAVGDTTSVLFMFKKADGTANDLGQGQFKEVMKALAASFGAKSNRELMEESNNAEVLVTTKVRKNDKNKDDVKFYTELVTLQVL